MKRQGESSHKPLPAPLTLPQAQRPLPLTPYLTLVSVSVSVSIVCLVPVPVASSTLYGIGYSSAPKVVKKMPSTLVDSQNSFSLRALVHNKAGLSLSLSLSRNLTLSGSAGDLNYFLSLFAHRLMCEIWLGTRPEIGLSQCGRCGWNWKAKHKDIDCICCWIPYLAFEKDCKYLYAQSCVFQSLCILYFILYLFI